MSKLPQVGERWIDHDGEECVIIKFTEMRVYRKFLNNVGNREGTRERFRAESVAIEYFLRSWKLSEASRVTQILSMYGE